uniref:Uncharacterized protein n=1 Tax=Anguilla anguilla TaxID=7936 RepID=A0A0E9WHK7_ANGAN
MPGDWVEYCGTVFCFISNFCFFKLVLSRLANYVLHKFRPEVNIN